MKKIVIAFGLVVIMVAGTFGGIVTAQSEIPPEDCCGYIVSAVDNIGDNMTFIVSEVENISDNMTFIVNEVEDIGYEVSEVSENVSYVVSAVDNISDNMTFIVDEVEDVGYEVSEVSENVSYVVSAVDNISDNMTFIVSEVAEMKVELNELSEDVDYVVSAVSNVPRMDTDYGEIKISKRTKLDGKPEAEFKYAEIRHVVLTLAIDKILGEGDGIYISAFWGKMNQGGIVATIISGNNDQVKTIEFNADRWTIDCESLTNVFMINYVVTSTYVPAAAR